MVELELSAIAAAAGGGAIIGIAASLYLLALGQIAGISGVMCGVLPGAERAGRQLRVAFLGGLVAAAAVMRLVKPAVFGPVLAVDGRDLATMAVAGLCVGIGTRVGSGCTSGHGVCGLSRGSQRSLAATVTFMAVAILVVWLRRTAGWP